MSKALGKEKISLVFLIIDSNYADEADSLMKSAGIPVRYRFNAEGTASGKLLDYFGLSSHEKIVLLCTVPTLIAPKFMDKLHISLHLEKKGRGIAFSVPVSGVSNLIVRTIESQEDNAMKSKIKSEAKSIIENTDFSLIIMAVDEGYSEKTMEVAKKAGAQGGTMIRARRLGMEEASQFWGINLQKERDIIAILVPKEKKIAIMQSLSEECGVHSDAKGLMLSLPVDGVVGLP